MPDDTPTGRRFRYVGRKRRTKEDKRFVLGRGRFVADVKLPGMLHAVPVASPHPAARIRGIDARAALALPGVHAVVTGAEIERDTDPLAQGLDVPNIRAYPLAVGRARYAGEWVAVVVADSRYVAEDAAELIEVDYEPLPYVVDPEEAYRPGSPLVHPDHGTNILYERRFVWGEVDGAFAAAEHSLSYSVRWGRSATVPIETFGVAARWDEGLDVLEVWASIQMPRFAEQIGAALRLPANSVRAYYDVDVGGSYGVKRGIKQSVLAGYLARRLGRPVRLIEDRLENMTGGDAHGPDRLFDVELAFDGDGTVKAMRMRALDDCGCYPGRAPLQLGKPVSAIVGPYRVASAEYEAISVSTNKTSQEAVRGFGQAPTNLAIEHGMDLVAERLGLDRIELRRRNLIEAHQFPYLIPSGTEYDSGDYQTVLDKALAAAGFEALVARRDAIRAEGRLAGIGIATCLEPGGGNGTFEALFNPKNDTTTYMESCLVKVDVSGAVTVMIATPTSGQGHETLASIAVGEVLEREPDSIRVLHSDTLSGMPTNTPVASRMAIMLGGAAAGAAGKIKYALLRIGAHMLDLPEEAVRYEDGDVVASGDPARRVPWFELVQTAHRRFHRLPQGMEPGLQALHVMEVPTGGTLPTEDGRVQMYPCFSFEAHVPLVEIDPGTGKVTVLDYTIGHDCGTIINPDIVRGMICGGVAHGIGAALYEKFEYDETGQLLSGSFVDYLLPSAHEVPDIRIVEHETPSPHTSFGQKGAGEGGYLGAPAAIVSAVNDALGPLGVKLVSVPMRPRDIEAALAAARAR
jgi:2-furoyl-CoA dehydrogenase large subunit